MLAIGYEKLYNEEVHLDYSTKQEMYFEMWQDIGTNCGRLLKTSTNFKQQNMWDDDNFNLIENGDNI
jgi:hypothetical protein